MPRRNRSSQGPLAEIRGALGRQPQSTGYDVENVCAFCLSMLQGEYRRAEKCAIPRRLPPTS